MHTSSLTRMQFSLFCILFLFLNIHIIRAQEKHYRVTFRVNKSELESLREKGLEMDHFYYENGKVIAEISKSDLTLLKKNNVQLKINIRNLEKRIPRINKRIDKKASKKTLKSKTQEIPTPNNFALGSMGGFYTIDEALSTLDKMQQLYPELITVKSTIGNSILGQPIYMVKISDNADVDEAEDELLFTAVHHAREPMGLTQLVYYMWYLLENYDSDEEIKTLVDHTELYFIPIVNPDGYAYNQQTNPNGGGYWRKNRRDNGGSFGVDLNRNYGYKWGTNSGSSSNPNNNTYHGTAGFSEPETQSVRDFSNQHQFIATLNYHAYSNLLIHPWGYSSNTYTPDQDTFVTMCNYMTEENSYAFGTPNQTVGYTATGSSDDWLYGEQSSKPKALSMSPEVGSSNDGFWPATSRIVPLCNEAFPMNIKLTRMVAKYAKVVPVDTDQTTNTTSGSVDFLIKRFSLNQSRWTVTLSSNSPYLSFTGQAIQYDNLELLETKTGSIEFELASNTSFGTIIPMTLTVNNGTWEYVKKVNIKYTGGSDTQAPSVPTGLVASNITSTSLTIFWKPSSDNIGVSGYEVYLGNHIVSTVSDTITNISGLITNTVYQFRIRSKDLVGNISGFSNSISVATTDENVSYCLANGNKSSDEYISNVKLGTINNESIASSEGYSDFTSMSTFLEAGASHTITITPAWSATVYKEAYGVWIDYNKDGDFEDTDELVWVKKASRIQPVIGEFIVPITAVTGNTRMRVIMRYRKTPSSCGTFDYGEVEDYTVVIGESKTNIEKLNYVIKPIAYNLKDNSLVFTDNIDTGGDNKVYNGIKGERKLSALDENSVIKVFPNPAENTLHVLFPNQKIQNFTIVDVLGKMVKTGVFYKKINIADLAKGIYVLKVDIGVNKFSKQFIKED